MPDRSDANLLRYHRQMQFAPLGVQAQRQLGDARVVVVGVGGLGSWSAELLARAGVGHLRLIDDDRVDVENLHRQSLYDQRDADRGRAKVDAAAERIAAVNPEVTVEGVSRRVEPAGADELLADADLLIDGTDNFPTRFLLNDYAVRERIPWIFAGVVAAEGQVMPVVPGRTACLRCVFDTPPPRCADPTCRTVGVLGPAVAAVASIQALEAIKILTGQLDQVSPYLLKLDLWNNTMQRIDTARSDARDNCPCCRGGFFDFLE